MRSSPGPTLLGPLRSFFATESASGIVLLTCTIVALALANSPLAASYAAFWQTKLTVAVGSFALSKPLLLWINDGLMAIFFFVVGLEIKREVLVGELSSVRGAALPLVAALGGMIFPAAIYVAIIAAAGPDDALRGWAIPTATDIAFALGVLALLGRRAPAGLKVFLTALAIADDLAAVLVIAFFYTSSISIPALACAGGIFAALIAANVLGVRRIPVYLVLGVAMWVAVLKSGVHSTVAGVLVAMTIPARRTLDFVGFLSRGRQAFEACARDGGTDPTPEQREAVYELEGMCDQLTEPMVRLEHALHPWVAFAVMPIFALANAGVALGTGLAVNNPVTFATFFGLWIGKQLGVFSFAWLSVHLGLAQLPAGTKWHEVYGVSCLCGIGFTMSLFIASLAFTSPAHLDSAKLGILAASLVSAVSGTFLLVIRRHRQPQS